MAIKSNTGSLFRGIFHVRGFLFSIFIIKKAEPEETEDNQQ